MRTKTPVDVACPQCGGTRTLILRPSDLKRVTNQVCRPCSSRNAIQANTRHAEEENQYLIGETRWLASFGVHPLRICEALNTKPVTLARRLQRANEHALANLIESAA